jgi:hypothetical protein
MASDLHSRLATRRIGAGAGAGPGPAVGAVDEYLALQVAAVDRIVRCGIDATEGALRMRAEAHRLARESDLDEGEALAAIEPILETVETAIGEVQDELRRLLLHSLRLGRNRLGLA